MTNTPDKLGWVLKRLMRIIAAVLAGIVFFIGFADSAPPTAWAVPANDNLASAKAIAFQPYTDWTDTTGATTEVGETTSFSGCQGDYSNPITGATVWYTYTHTDPNETLQLETLGGQTDAVIAVYSGTSAAYGALTFIACGDADFSLDTSLNDAGLTFSATTGTTYYIQLGGFGGAAGSQMLNLSHVVSTAGTLYTVNSTGDGADSNTGDGVCDDGAGNCTLRAAIQQANANSGTDNIRFSIGSGAVSISPGSALPQITSSAVIDGRTQPGFGGAPIVELAGNLAGSAVGIDTCSGCGSNVIRGLVINRFAFHGIALWGPNNVVQGNYLGTDVSGSADLGNQYGVFLVHADTNTIGGTTITARNVISGNNAAGIWMRAGVNGSAKSNVVLGNEIGTAAGGMSALGNGIGIYIDGGDSGADASGNVIGGSWPGARNVISGNYGYEYAGVLLVGAGVSQTQVQGNYIGVNSAGSGDLGNAYSGVEIVGSTDNVIDANVISGNDGVAAVRICGAGATCSGFSVTTPATFNQVSGNYIGTAADGITPIGNAGDGVRFDSAASSNVGLGTPYNTIANNGGAGVRVMGSSTAVFISGYITANGGLGIDLDPPGVTPNDVGDSDTGPNDLQNYPVITSAYTVGGVTIINGTLNSKPNSWYIPQIFLNSSCDGTNGEGETPVNVLIPVLTDASGNASFSYSNADLFIPPVAPGMVITATATSWSWADGTSEFSACRLVTTDEGDGLDEATELACGSNPADINSIPERVDGVFFRVDDDGNDGADEPLPVGAANSDCDGDGYTGSEEAGTPLCGNGMNDDGNIAAGSDDGMVDDGCPGGPAQEGAYSEAEFSIGVSDQDPCGGDWAADLVPLDSSSYNLVNVLDLSTYVGTPRRLNTRPGDPGFDKRWDVVPGPAAPGGFWIDVLDLSQIAGLAPPMLGGVRAFQGPECPWPP